MLKVLLVGNSHLAALKAGWEAYPKRPSWSIQFYGSPGISMEGLRHRKDGSIVAGEPRLSKKMLSLWGSDEVRPDDFDFIFVAGLAPGAFAFANDYVKMNGVPNSNDELRGAARQLVSRSLAAGTVATLRQVTGRPIIVIETPGPSSDRFPDEKALSSIVVNNARAFSDALLWGLQKMDGVDDALRQPDETKVFDIFTKPEYSRGSVRLSSKSIEHSDFDSKHMNGDFGVKVIQEIDRSISGGRYGIYSPARSVSM